VRRQWAGNVLAHTSERGARHASRAGSPVPLALAPVFAPGRAFIPPHCHAHCHGRRESPTISMRCGGCFLRLPAIVRPLRGHARAGERPARLFGRVSVHQCFCLCHGWPLHGPLHGHCAAYGRPGSWRVGAAIDRPGSCHCAAVGGRGAVPVTTDRGAAGELAQISLDNVVVIYCFCTTIKKLSKNSTKGID
jgi:hypothetical protein